MASRTVFEGQVQIQDARLREFAREQRRDRVARKRPGSRGFMLDFVGGMRSGFKGVIRRAGAPRPARGGQMVRAYA